MNKSNKAVLFIVLGVIVVAQAMAITLLVGISNSLVTFQDETKSSLHELDRQTSEAAYSAKQACENTRKDKVFSC